MATDWMKFYSETGAILFYYNKKTTEHRWPDTHNNSKPGMAINHQPVDLKSTGTQTEYIGYGNGCPSPSPSAFVDHVKSTPLHTSIESLAMTAQDSNSNSSFQPCVCNCTDLQSSNEVPLEENTDFIFVSPIDGNIIQNDLCSSSLIETNLPKPPSEDRHGNGHFISDFTRELSKKGIQRSNKQMINKENDTDTTEKMVLQQVLDKILKAPDQDSAIICPQCQTSFKCNCSANNVLYTAFKTNIKKLFKCLQICNNNTQSVEALDKQLVSTEYLGLDSSIKDNYIDLPTKELKEKISTQLTPDSLKSSRTLNPSLDISLPSDEHINSSKDDNHAGVANKDKTLCAQPSPSLKCPWCPQTFKFSYALHRHKFIHIGQPYRCDNCGKSFVQEKSLYRHQQTDSCTRQYECKDKTFDKTFEQGDVTREPATTENPCQEMKSLQDIAGREIEEKFVSQKYSQNTLQCSVCSKLFKYPYDLKRHERSHSGDKPFPCGICGKGFKQKAHAYSHEMEVHTNVKRKSQAIKPYPCETCGKSYKQLSHLKNHELVVHLGVRPHQCETCGKSFSRLSSLKKHELYHGKTILQNT